MTKGSYIQKAFVMLGELTDIALRDYAERGRLTNDYIKKKDEILKWMDNTSDDWFLSGRFHEAHLREHFGVDPASRQSDGVIVDSVIIKEDL